MVALVRWTWAALLSAAAVIAAGLSWASINQVENPEAVLRIMPWHSGALLEVTETARSKGASSPRDLVLAGNQMLRMAPLLDAPLVYLGLDRAEAGEVGAARRAFELAAKRQPRNIPALSWLAEQAARDRDFNKVAKLLDQLSRVDPRRKDVYADAFASIRRDPKGAEVFERALDQGSSLALVATEKLIAVSGDLQFLMRAAETAPRFRHQLVERITREQGIEAAFVAWLSFLPSVEARSLTWPFDPAFVGNDAPAPFNWQLMPDAERLKEGGLLARYAGRGRPVFAKQVMLLGPGSYRFAAVMDGELSASGGGFVWRIKCLPREVEIVNVPVSRLARTLATQSEVFEVPGAGCSSQILSLEGMPGTLTTRARASVRRVSIRPADVGAQ